MKAAAFEIVRAGDAAEAVAALAQPDTKLVAGWQSLGPMLNLRLAAPARLVAIGHLPDLRGVEETAETVVWGACVTHAQVEDGMVPDPLGGALRAAAAGIAYRAVRNRGTVGGSLAHADPAGDWPTLLAAAGARVRVMRAEGVRVLELDDLQLGAFVTTLAPDEMIVAVEVPKASAAARWGYWKFCRKIGEYAEAMAAVLVDPERGVARLAVGATDGRPLVVAEAGALLRDEAALAARLHGAGLCRDPVAGRLRLEAVRRALAQVDLPRFAA